MAVATHKTHRTAINSCLPVLVPVWDAAAESHMIREQGRCLLGSDPGCEFTTQLSGVRGRHCELSYQNGVLTVSAVDGAVWVNDAPICRDSRLLKGDLLAVGPALFRVDQIEQEPNRSGELKSEIDSVVPDLSSESEQNVPEHNVRTSAIDDFAARESLQRQIDLLAQRLTESELHVKSPATKVTVKTALEEDHAHAVDKESDPECNAEASESNDESKVVQIQAEQDLLIKTVELSEQEEELSRRENELALRNEECRATEAAVQRAREELEERQRELDNQQEEISARLLKVEDQQNSVAEMLRTLDEQSEEIQRRNQELTTQEKALQAQADRLNHSAVAVKSQAEDLAVREKEWKAEYAQQTEELQSARVEIEVIQQQVEQVRENVEQEKLDHHRSVADTDQRELLLHEREEALAERESGLEQRIAELKLREQTVDEAACKLANATDQNTEAVQKIEQQQVDCSAWESELNARHEELAARIVELKTLQRSVAENRETSSEPTASVSEIHALTTELQEARLNVESLSNERDDLTTALNELRTAFETAKQELIAQQNCTESSVDQTEELEHTTQQLAESQRQLEQKNSQVEQLKEELKFQRQAAAEEKERLEQQLHDNNESGADEESLLGQIEELRRELSEAQEDDRNKEFEQTQELLSEKDARIDELSDKLKEVTDQLGTLSQSQVENTSSEEEFQSQIEQRDGLIRELKNQLEATALAAKAEEAREYPEDEEQIRMLHRELDQRTHLLDEREDDIRERNRKLENTEEELETQRRELLEARQQLELARAELQVSMDGDEPSVEQVNEDTHQPAVAENEVVDEERQDESASGGSTELRSELAQLFGLGSDTNANSEADPEEHIQEDRSSVAMSFENAGSVLLTPEASEEEDDGEDDDFVASYMEQLLSRNRQKAGGSLPEELAQPKETKQPKPAEKAPEAPKPQTTSFIDAYMSGDLEVDEQPPVDGQVIPEEDVAAAVAEIVRPAAERPKIDRQALKNDMASFRAVSAQSVEKALASHAKRKEQGGITTRKTIIGALALTTLFFLAANLLEVIQAPYMTWIMVTATAIAVGELCYKFYLVHQKYRQLADTVSGESMSKELSENPQHVVETGEHPEISPEPDQHPELSDSETITAPKPESSADDEKQQEDVEEEYFEI